MAIMEYRTQDGLADYGFSIEFQPDVGWRVYIIFIPFRLNHEDSMDLPYQCADRDGRRYVDWSSKLKHLGDARSVAALWAELTQRYLRAQEQHAVYVDLIQRYLRAKGQRNTTPVGSDRPNDMVGAGGSDAGRQDCSPVIPHPSATVKSFSDHQKTEWSGREPGHVLVTDLTPSRAVLT